MTSFAAMTVKTIRSWSGHILKLQVQEKLSRKTQATYFVTVTRDEEAAAADDNIALRRNYVAFRLEIVCQT